MSCGLSLVELYGARMLNTRMLSETMNDTGLSLSFFRASSINGLTHGMYRTQKISDEEQESTQQYPVFGMPLHRSPAVLAALSGLEDEKSDDDPRRCASSVGEETNDLQSQRGSEASTEPTEEKKVAESVTSQSLCERRKIMSNRSVEHRQSARIHPYERSRAPVHIVIKDENTKGIYSSPSWPTGLLNPYSQSDDTNISKSFSSPGNLDHFIESSRLDPRLSGDQMHRLAIQTLSNKFRPPPTQVTFSPSATHPTPTIAIASRNPCTQTSSSRSQQKDNFRRLLVSRNDQFSGSLSNRDFSLQRIIHDSLAANGLCVIDGLLGSELATKIKKEVLEIHSRGNVVRGDILGTGRKETSTRGDVISWVDGTEEHCQSLGLLCQKMDRIVSVGGGVAPAYRICGGTKAMVARYPGGGSQYKLHVDNPNKDGRCLTCLYYLNENWNVNTMGGQLRVHAKTRGKTAEIAPIFDRLAVFYSDGRNPHEVLKCYADRYAVTLWYFDLDERAKALERMDSMSHSSPREDK